MLRRNFLSVIPLPFLGLRGPAKSLSVIRWIHKCNKLAENSDRPFDFVDVSRGWIENKNGIRSYGKYCVSIYRRVEGYNSDNPATWGNFIISDGMSYPEKFETFEEAVKIGREVAQHFKCELQFRGGEQYGA